MKYEPKLNDYVSWRNVEGWVYFVDEEYLTIEIAVKPKADDLVPLHKNHHCLICLLYTSPSPRDLSTSRMPSSA